MRLLEFINEALVQQILFSLFVTVEFSYFLLVYAFIVLEEKNILKLAFKCYTCITLLFQYHRDVYQNRFVLKMCVDHNQSIAIFVNIDL